MRKINAQNIKQEGIKRIFKTLQLSQTFCRAPLAATTSSNVSFLLWPGLSYSLQHLFYLSFFIRYWMNLTPSDIMWNTSDTGWVKAAWSSVFAPWICGSCVFVHNMPQFKSEVIAEVSLIFYTVKFISILHKWRKQTGFQSMGATAQ